MVGVILLLIIVPIIAHLLERLLISFLFLFNKQHEKPTISTPPEKPLSIIDKLPESELILYVKNNFLADKSYFNAKHRTSKPKLVTKEWSTKFYKVSGVYNTKDLSNEIVIIRKNDNKIVYKGNLALDETGKYTYKE